MTTLAQLIAVIHDAPAGAFWSVSSIVAACAAAALAGALRSLARKRMVENTPTALVRSAAQGYTELRGMAELMAGDPILAPASLRVCVWYKYKIERLENSARHGDRQRSWEVVEQGVSDSLFFLTDTSGSCAVDPEGAQVRATRRDRWYGQTPRPGSFRPPHSNALMRWASSLGQPYRYTEQLIRPGDALYIIGQFITHGGGGTAPLERDDNIADRLSAWKRDQPALLREFDTNRDGRIDGEEWAAVRARVAREVEAESDAGQQAPPPVDVIAQTRARGRPFVISAGGEDQVVADCQRQALTLLGLSVSLAVAVLWAWLLRLT